MVAIRGCHFGGRAAQRAILAATANGVPKKVPANSFSPDFLLDVDDIIL